MPTQGINRGKFPLIVFDTAEDLTTWSVVGTPVVTGSLSDPVGGTGATDVEDNDGAALEYIYKIIPSTINDGKNTFAAFVKEITAPSGGNSEIEVYDNTAAASRVVINLAWSASVPTASIGSGSGEVGAAVDCGGGWYLILFTANNIVASNENRWRLKVTSPTTSETGKLRFYIRNVVASGEPIDNAISGSVPRAGSRHVQASGGTVEDAWITGRDQQLTGDIRWIPAVFQTSPRVGSGWDGDGEHAGVNVGYHWWLEWAQDKQTFLWVPDRSVSTKFVTSFLVDPMEGLPGNESDATRRLVITIRSSDGSKYIGY